MRPGDRIRRYEVMSCNVETAADEMTQYGPTGTVIEYDSSESINLPRVVIRWDNGPLETIEARDEMRDRTFIDVTPCCYCNVYLYDRAYGGPEEGGWWYDEFTPVADECLEHISEEHAQAHADKAIAWAAEENSHRASPHSVHGEGHYVVRVEAYPAEAYPKARPHYC